MKLLTLTEAAITMGITRQQLRSGIQRGEYPAMQWGNRLLVDIDEVWPIVDGAQRQIRDTVGLRECAEMLGISADALRRMTRCGLVPHLKVGRQYRFRPDEVEVAIRQQMKRGL